MVANPRARRVVVYTWNFHPDLIESARQHGAHGYLSKTLPARELVAALEGVHSGDVVISEVAMRARSAPGLDWPGRGEGLSDREAEDTGRPAARRPCCGAWSTGSPRTITASNIGAAVRSRRQNRANCSSTIAVSVNSSMLRPPTTAPTPSMNCTSETTGTPNCRAW